MGDHKLKPLKSHATGGIQVHEFTGMIIPLTRYGVIQYSVSNASHNELLASHHGYP